MGAPSFDYPKISIITVCYNSKVTLRDTFESVVAQTYENIEYIVIDGGSKDGTVGIIEEFRDSVDYFVSEEDDGIYDAMNKGVSAATGDVVGILNSDDFFESDDVVESVAKIFETEPDCDMVFGNVVFVDSEDLTKVTRFYSAAHFQPWKLRFGWMPPHPATFVRRSAYERVGKYRLDMRISADYEMFVRWFLDARLRWRYLDKVLVRMRSGGVSTGGARSSITLNNEIVRACRENGVYTNLLMVLSKIPFKLLELMRRPK